MSNTLTVQLESDVLDLAEKEARAHSTTLNDVVRQQLQIMAQNWKDSQAGKTPLTDALRGAAPLPTEFDERAVLAKEIAKKHGVRE